MKRAEGRKMMEVVVYGRLVMVLAVTLGCC